ncbi:MAG: High molecular weight rubredoxin [bacterium ADurb.Bin363]|nr:MAG: High molecular weight rubredoxin [bacterium ADurb.Bin363]
MNKYICTMCNYIYNEEKGDTERGIAPGTMFLDLPDTWTCPVCGATKDKFFLSYDQGPRRKIHKIDKV